MSSSHSSVFSTKIKCVHVLVNISNDTVNISDNVNKDNLLILLKNKLLKGIERTSFDEEQYNETLSSLTSRGIYSEIVISKLLRNGMSKESILKAMKRGLFNLQPDELCFFNTFNITPDVLRCQNSLSSNFDQELLTKLCDTGIDESDCLNIILCGLINQSDYCLFRLSVNGITVVKILNWQGPLFCVTDEIICFLEKLGIDENTIEIISKNGISEEALEMLNDLGFSKFKNNNLSDFSKSTCDLQVEENVEQCLLSSETSNGSIIEQYFVGESKKEMISEKTDYLRKNLMAPLTWAMDRVLMNNPADAAHYIACQLIRWKYYLDADDQNKIIDYVNKATIKRDKFLNEKSTIETISTQSNKPSCQFCLNEMELHRVKECCWKCKKTLLPENKKCEFPEKCSFCKLDEPKNF